MSRKVPHRKTFSIPKADESTLAWWDAQDDASLSLRLLVREEIQRNGYTDTANRPVEQLPRRGRPPKTEVDEDYGGYDAEQDEDRSAEDDSVEQSVEPEPVAPEPAASEVDTAPAQPKQSKQKKPKKQQPKVEPVVEPEPEPEVEDTADDEAAVAPASDADPATSEDDVSRYDSIIDSLK